MKNFFKRLFYKNKHVLVKYAEKKHPYYPNTQKCGVYQEIDFDGKVVKTYIKYRNDFGQTETVEIDTVACDRDNLIIYC